MKQENKPNSGRKATKPLIISGGAGVGTGRGS